MRYQLNFKKVWETDWQDGGMIDNIDSYIKNLPTEIKNHIETQRQAQVDLIHYVVDDYDFLIN